MGGIPIPRWYSLQLTLIASICLTPKNKLISDSFRKD